MTSASPLMFIFLWAVELAQVTQRFSVHLAPVKTVRSRVHVNRKETEEDTTPSVAGWTCWQTEAANICFLESCILSRTELEIMIISRHRLVVIAQWEIYSRKWMKVSDDDSSIHFLWMSESSLTNLWSFLQSFHLGGHLGGLFVFWRQGGWRIRV